MTDWLMHRPVVRIEQELNTSADQIKHVFSQGRGCDVGVNALLKLAELDDASRSVCNRDRYEFIEVVASDDDGVIRLSFDESDQFAEAVAESGHAGYIVPLVPTVNKSIMERVVR